MISLLQCSIAHNVTEETFLCVSCDAKEGGITIRKHSDTHALVQCHWGLMHVESGSAELQATIDSLKDKVASLDDRTQRIDNFLLHPAKVIRSMGARVVASVEVHCVIA